MSAKQNILAKLRKSLSGTTPLADNFDEALVTEPWRYAPEQRIAQLRKLMEAVHTEIHLTTAADWPQRRARLHGQGRGRQAWHPVRLLIAGGELNV